MPHDAAQRAECEKIFTAIVAEEGQRVLGWRDIPTNNASLGATAKASEPFMRQVFIARNAKLADDLAFERKLYVIRKRAENAIRYSGKVKGGDYFYLSSLSLQDGRLQGHVADDAARRVLPGPVASGDGVGAGAGSFAFQHEHVSELEPRASVSLPRAQRRDQHAARQHQLDARRPVEFPVRVVRRRHQEDPARHQHRRQRLGDVRQLPRTARHGGARIAARGDDDDSRAVGKSREHVAGETRVLRISFLPDGAVGRPGVHRVFRRRPDWRVPRPQRPASVALLRHEGRPRHHGVGSRRAGRSAGTHCCQRAVCNRAACFSWTRNWAASSPTRS